MRVGMAWIAAVGLLPVASCVESIPLGSECPERFANCSARDPEIEDVRPSVRTPDGGRTRPIRPLDSGLADGLDGGLGTGAALDAEARDAGLAPTSVADAGPVIANGSFELTRGRTGLLALEVLERLTSTRIDPWKACWIGFGVLSSASPVRGGAPGVVPTQGETFMENELMFAVMRGGLTQPLTRTIARGERLGLRIDVRASQGADATLELWGGQLACMPSAKLADVGIIPSERWESRCLSVTAPSDLSYLMLIPGSRTPDRDGERVFFDNLREDPSCR